MSTEKQLYQYGDFSYSMNESREIIIRHYNGSDSCPLIPTEINGMPVTVLGKNSFFASPIESITVPEGIRTIETNAFAVCDDLQKVVLPCSLATIGQGIFQGSEMVEDVSISGESSNFIVADGILYDRNENRLVYSPPGLKLEKVIVPYGTVTIADSAFYCNSHLQYISLPLTLQYIESSAFLFTSSMRIIELPPYLKEIADNAFLVGLGPYAEKPFDIFAFPGTKGYEYAEKNRISVHPLYGIVTD